MHLKAESERQRKARGRSGVWVVRFGAVVVAFPRLCSSGVSRDIFHGGPPARRFLCVSMGVATPDYWHAAHHSALFFFFFLCVFVFSHERLALWLFSVTLCTTLEILFRVGWQAVCCLKEGRGGGGECWFLPFRRRLVRSQEWRDGDRRWGGGSASRMLEIEQRFLSSVWL